VLMHEQACPISKQPELKAAAVVVAPAVSVLKPLEQTEGRLQRLRRLVLQRSTSAKAASKL
jgi:ferredoxin-nitrate reductase